MFTVLQNQPLTYLKQSRGYLAEFYFLRFTCMREKMREIAAGGGADLSQGGAVSCIKWHWQIKAL